MVMSRDAALAKLNTAIVAPCTTNIRGLASEVVLEPGDDPVDVLSAVNLDSVESVAQAMLTERMGRLSDRRMRQICTALSAATACG